MQSDFYISFQISWPKKLFLAQGIIRGMEYLHSIQPHPVIHGDLKIQNVLVGTRLVAKVCIIVKMDILTTKAQLALGVSAAVRLQSS